MFLVAVVVVVVAVGAVAVAVAVVVALLVLVLLDKQFKVRNILGTIFHLQISSSWGGVCSAHMRESQQMFLNVANYNIL